MNEKKLQTVCFTGHRQMKEATTKVEYRLTKIIESLIQKKYIYFCVGGARGFDILAAETVLKLKKQYPKIQLILVLPFDKQYQHEKGWEQLEIEQYHQLKIQASKVIILASEYHSGIYYKRNRYLVDNSSICIAYMTRKNSGTGYTVNYAETQKLQIINIALS